MTTRKKYVVTTLAGPKVAGVAVKAGDPIELTDAEAASEFAAGAISADGKPPEVFEKASPKLQKIQAAARGEDLAAAEPAPPVPEPASKAV